MVKIIFYFFYFAIVVYAQDLAKDLTKNIEFLGSPYKDFYKDGEDSYSRNVWDMQIFDDRLYFGAGNSSNQAPSKNSGPVPVISYDLKTKTFQKEFSVDDEQIDIFELFGTNLVIPGHDATQSWDYGNFYVKSTQGDWTKFRNIPKAIHVYDMEMFESKLYAAIGIPNFAAVGVLEGGAWRVEKVGNGRVYGMLKVGDTLFALQKFKSVGKPHFGVLQLGKDGFVLREDLFPKDFCPDTQFTQKEFKLTKITPYKEGVFYLGAYKYNDHQSIPFGVYEATLQGNKIKAKKIDLGDFVPKDIIVKGQKLFILASKKENNFIRNSVFEYNIKNATTATEIFNFKYKIFARAFEELNGDFYFGFGYDFADENNWNEKEFPEEIGNIIKIRNQ